MAIRAAGAFDHSFAADCARSLLAFTGTQPLEATLRITLTARNDEAVYYILAAKIARGIEMSKQMYLYAASISDNIRFPSPDDHETLGSFVERDTPAGETTNWTRKECSDGGIWQHDMQLLAPTAANSAAVSRWFQSLALSLRDWKPSESHSLPWTRMRWGSTLTIEAVSLCCGTHFDEHTVRVAGGLYCEPLTPAAPALAFPWPPGGAMRAVEAAPGPGLQGAPEAQFVYEDESLPAAWTPEQCASFDSRCAAYHARTARIGTRVAELVAAWHAVPMTCG